MLGRANSMSITVNGQSRVPPGFRFHPTEEELLNYYLRKKAAGEKIDLDVIMDVDLNKLEPWDLQEKCRIGSTPQNDWYFFSHKDKKYPTGTRTNRATAAGFWKATGRDKVIYTSCKRIGMRKTLVFYRGRAPHGQKSDWIMHEYRLDEQQDASSQSRCSNTLGEASAPEDGWVVCRVFKKKSHHKALGSPNNSSSVTSDAKTQMLHSCNDGALDQILQYLGRSCKQESDTNAINPTLRNTTTTTNSGSCHLRYLRPSEATVVNGHQERFMKLPALESPSLPPLLGDCPPAPVDLPCSSQSSYPASDGLHALLNSEKSYLPHEEYAAVSDWAALDRLVASHLSVQSETSKQLASCFEDQGGFGACCSSATNRLLGSSGSCQDYHQGDMDLWAFARSASPSGPPDQLCRAAPGEPA